MKSNKNQPHLLLQRSWWWLSSGITYHAVHLTVQVHTQKRKTSVGFVCVHIRTGPPSSLGFPLTLRLHFLLFEFLFSLSTSEKVERYSFGSSVCFEKGQHSLSVISQIFVPGACLFIQGNFVNSAESSKNVPVLSLHSCTNVNAFLKIRCN